MFKPPAAVEIVLEAGRQHPLAVPRVVPGVQQQGDQQHGARADGWNRRGAWLLYGI